MTTLSLPLDDGLLDALRELARHENTLARLLDREAEVTSAEYERLGLAAQIAKQQQAVGEAEHAVAGRVMIEARMASLVAPIVRRDRIRRW